MTTSKTCEGVGAEHAAGIDIHSTIFYPLTKETQVPERERQTNSWMIVDGTGFINSWF
jgi:hypothetical protein